MARAAAPGLSDLAAEAPQPTPERRTCGNMVEQRRPPAACAWSASSGSNPVTVDRSDDRPGATLVDLAASFNRLPESRTPRKRDSSASWASVAVRTPRGELVIRSTSALHIDRPAAYDALSPADTRPVLADMDELSIIVEEG